jgi:hypothetical protein
MNLYDFFKQLEATATSTAIRESILFYPIIETTHVLSLCLFVGLIALMDLRLVGIGLPGVPVSQIMKRIQPLGIAGFVLMVLSGALLFYSSPLRAYTNIFFRIKVLLILLAGLNAALFHFTIFRKLDSWDSTEPAPPRARLAGALSLLFWSGVVICGRMQAYKWFE